MFFGFLKKGLPVVSLALALGAPARLEPGGSPCSQSLAQISLTLRATGVEPSGNWALISTSQREDLLLSEGDPIDHCLVISQVTNNSIIVRSAALKDTRQFFFNGFSARPVERKASPAAARDGFLRAVAGHSLTPLSSNLDKIEYPPYSNNNTLPHVVYKNERGAALYEDLDALGLGQNPQPRSPGSELAGVTIGENSPNSIFGALGLTTGDRIVAINGHEVSNPQDIGRLMREAGNTPIHIGYAEGESSGVLTTAALIKTL